MARIVDNRLVVGSFTRKRPFFREVRQGLSLLAFDAESGGLEHVDQLGALPSPSYLRPHAGGVLAVCEEARGEAALAFVTIADDRLTVAGVAAVPGDLPCHLDVHPGGAWAACACYGSGHVSVHALDANAAPSKAVSVRLHEGASVHPTRQTGPHAHAARFSPDGAWLLAADLGTDHIWCHRFADGQMIGAASRWSAPPGSGPRLLAFAPDVRHLVVVLELSNEVASLAWHDGDLRQVAIASTLRAGDPSAGSTAAGLRWHPDGARFAVSTRGADIITLFRHDAATGAIETVSAVGCGGIKPRDVTFSPCGRWLIVANQDSDTLAIFAVEGDRMLDTGQRAAVACPSCVRFL